MKRLLEHISKSLVLLAAILLPVEQAWAATCCCRGGYGRDTQMAAGSQKSCCSQSQSACCSTAGSLLRSCCHHSQPESGSKPSHCSGGCYGQDAPDAVDPAMFQTSPDDESVVDVVLTIALDAAGDTAPGSLQSTASPSPTSGSQRCVLLCRYRL